jgi:hypothetical protein
MEPKPANVKKVLLWTGAAVFALLLFLFLYGTYRDDLVKYFVERRERLMNEEARRVMAEIEEAYQNDHDGGTTPEETIGLFLAALRAGDSERASTYYELSVQPKALEGLENGGFEERIKFIVDIQNKG